ncbi:MAG: hypothetical protein WBX20_18050 [Terrimicrobiaceae bacterium]
MRPLHRASILLAACALLLMSRLEGVGQLTFYGAPTPSDVAANVGGSETGPPALLGIFDKRPYKMTFAVREGFDSNVFQTRDNPDSSFYTNWAAGLNYSAGNSRFQLQTSLGAGLTCYYTRPGDKLDFNGLFDLNATYLATPRLTLSFDTSTAYLSQPDQTIVGGNNQQNGDYVYSTTTVAAAYRVTETVSSVTSYNFATIVYTQSDTNDQLGYVSQTLAQSFRWLWKPRTALVTEYRINLISYFSADLGSLGNYFLVGFDQTVNPRLTWSVRGGLQVNLNKDPVDGSSTYFGPYGQSILSYQFGEGSVLSWSLRYGTEASGLADVSQRQTFRTGLVLVRAITARISANLAADYQGNYYDQSGVISSFFENVFNISAGVKFTVNRLVSLETGYQFSADYAPDETSREYKRNVVFMGVNTSF